MSIWGDKKILKMIMDGSIGDVYDGAINPASINVRLGRSFASPWSNYRDNDYICLGDEIKYDEFYISEDSSDFIEIGPGDFMLATTMESFDIPLDCAAFVQGRSSIGRAGLTVQNAGFVDPGFKGHITLELKNDAPYSIILIPGYPVAQLVFMDASDVTSGYSGKYNGQVDATGSRMNQDDLKQIFGDVVPFPLMRLH